MNQQLFDQAFNSTIQWMLSPQGLMVMAAVAVALLCLAFVHKEY